MNRRRTFDFIFALLLIGLLTACIPATTLTSEAPGETAYPLQAPATVAAQVQPTQTSSAAPATVPVIQTVVPETPAAEAPVTEPGIAPAIPPTEAEGSPVATLSQPPAPPTTASAGPTLAFLKGGDIWLLDTPGLEPYPLTVAGDILGFTWAPDGQRLAAFNGHTLCFYYRDGSVRTACLDLGLDDQQAKIARRLVMSPDQRYVVLWNNLNPQEQGTIGWMIVALDSSNIMYRIQDPKDWGAELDPDQAEGGFTGQPVFLPDGRLLGSLSHKRLCGEAGCHYQLYQFDFDNRRFIPFDNQPEDGFSEGLSLSLSRDGTKLANYGAFFDTCDSFVTLIDVYDIGAASRTTYNMQGVAAAGIGFSPFMDAAVISRTSGCVNNQLKTWAGACGLAPGFDILPMQSWKMDEEGYADLVPGVEPAFSSDGSWLSFRSCLAQDDAGAWQTSETTPAGLYLLNPTNGEIISLGDGLLPQWQP